MIKAFEYNIYVCFIVGEITLVALGPLTNLAVAYRLDDALSTKLHRLVIMGGNTQGSEVSSNQS